MGERPIKAILDPYNPVGSTRNVNFTTSRPLRWETAANVCHVNVAICDSTWELEFCRIAEKHPAVRRWVRNQNLGLEIPYQSGGVAKRYIPDFLLLLEDGRGDEDLLHLIVEVKGYRRDDVAQKSAAVQQQWVPGVNNLGSFGRWAFVELNQQYAMEADLKYKMESLVGEMLAEVLPKSTAGR
jgi:type III restriction enzyme